MMSEQNGETQQAQSSSVNQDLNESHIAGLRKRVQLEFSEATYRELIELKKEGGERTISGIIRNALFFYGAYVKYKKQGYVTKLHGPNGEVIELPAFPSTFR